MARLGELNLVYGLYRLVGAVLARLPLETGYRLAERTSGLVQRLSPAKLDVFTRNAQHVLGPGATADQVAQTVRRSFANLSKGQFELFRFPRLSDTELQAWMRVVGRERLDEALAWGNGVIAISAHLGSVEGTFHVIRLLKVPMTAPMLRVGPEPLFQYVRRLRQVHNVHLLPMDEPLLELFRALRRGEMVAVMVDLDPTQTGVTVEFLGKPARLPSGAAQIALRSGAPLLPVFVIREPDNSLLVRIEPPQVLERTRDRQQDLLQAVQRIARTLEPYVRDYPDQWIVRESPWAPDPV